jgi:hypothetical protein
MSIESTVGVTEVVYETPHTLPNGAVIRKSVLPTIQMGFNQWAEELSVSSSYIPTLPTNRAMEQILQWGIGSR